MKLSHSVRNKKVIIFDLDGTLTESKGVVSKKISHALSTLLLHKKVAVIGGGSFESLRNQLIKHLRVPLPSLKNLSLFPTNGAAAFFWRNGWKRDYEKKLTKSEAKKILSAFKKTLNDIHYKTPRRVWGGAIQNRGAQITFSALGQNAPLPQKKAWNRTMDVRERIAKNLQTLLPQNEVRIAGLTSIDVTKKGIDKAYGVRQIQKHFKERMKDMVFVGDALFPGGNDYSAKKTGIDCIAVSGPQEAEAVIKNLL